MLRAFGFAQQGAQNVITMSYASTNVVQETFPFARITVYLTGTTNFATIFHDNLTPPTPLANPFTADENGWWWFYAADGRYDVQITPTMTPDCPWTIGDIYLGDASSVLGEITAPMVALAPSIDTWTNVQDALTGLYADITGVTAPNVALVPNVNVWGNVQDAVAGLDANVNSALSGVSSLQNALNNLNASQVALAAPLDSWTNVQDALTGIAARATPGGSNTQIQFNNNGAFGASPNLVWDNGRVGIGTASPNAKLDVIDDNATTGLAALGILSERYSNDQQGPIFFTRKSRGTAAAPLPIIGGDWIFFIGGRGNNPAFTGEAMCAIAAISTPDAMGANLSLYTNDGTNLGEGYERIKITSTGLVGINQPLPQYQLDVMGTVHLQDHLFVNRSSDGMVLLDMTTTYANLLLPLAVYDPPAHISITAGRNGVTVFPVLGKPEAWVNLIAPAAVQGAFGLMGGVTFLNADIADDPIDPEHTDRAVAYIMYTLDWYNYGPTNGQISLYTRRDALHHERVRITSGGRVLLSPDDDTQPFVILTNGMEVSGFATSTHFYGKPGWGSANDAGEAFYMFMAGSAFDVLTPSAMANNLNLYCSKDIIFHSNVVPPFSGERLRIAADHSVAVRTDQGIVGFGQSALYGTGPYPITVLTQNSQYGMTVVSTGANYGYSQFETSPFVVAGMIVGTDQNKTAWWGLCGRAYPSPGLQDKVALIAPHNLLILTNVTPNPDGTPGASAHVFEFTDTGHFIIDGVQIH